MKRSHVFARGQKRARRSQARAGFSLVELMVAMIAGSFVIVGAYYMNDVSAKMFNEQLRRAETQMTLRSATEQIRRDIGRAGYLSVRDTGDLIGCDQTANRGDEINLTQSAFSPRPVFAARVASDGRGGQMLDLTGNLTTNEQYFVANATPNAITLDANNEGYRRSFIDPRTNLETFMPVRFQEAFLPLGTGSGRMLSITDLGMAKIFLRDIASISLATIPPTIQLVTPLPVTATGCMSVGLAVAPVSTFRYSIDNATSAQLARVGGKTYLTGQSAAGAGHPVLVRTEIDMSTGLPIPGTERLILDSVAPGGLAVPAGLVVEAVYDDPAVPGVDLTYTATPETLANQGTIRSLIIQLTVESSESQEGGAVAVSRAAAGRRWIRFEVMLPNAARNSGVF